MPEIGINLAEIRRRIDAACLRSDRQSRTVELIAVSKTCPADSIREAFEAGQLAFGESKVQEGEAKIALLPAAIQWHFIGRIQRNKVRKLLQNFGYIHAIDSLRLAAYADEVSRELGVFPKVFLQVNVGDESSKGGFSAESLRSELGGLLNLDRLEIIGLMCIPPEGADAESARPWFTMLRHLRDELEIKWDCKLSGLSMGMSGDFEVAIEEGATHVRVGSSIFGKRSYRVEGELG